MSPTDGVDYTTETLESPPLKWRNLSATRNCYRSVMAMCGELCHIMPIPYLIFPTPYYQYTYQYIRCILRSIAELLYILTRRYT